MAQEPVYGQQTSMISPNLGATYTGTVIGDVSQKYWAQFQDKIDTTLDRMAVEQGAAAGEEAQSKRGPNDAPASAGWLLGMTTSGRAYNEASRKVLAVQKEGQLATARDQALQQNPTDPAAANAAFADASKQIMANVPPEMAQGMGMLQQQYRANLDTTVQRNVLNDQKGQQRNGLIDDLSRLATTVRTAPENSPEYGLAMGQAADLIENGAKAGLISREEARSQRDQLNFYRLVGVGEKQVQTRAQLQDLKDGKIQLAGMDTLPVGMRMHVFQFVDHEITRKEHEARMGQALAAAAAAQKVDDSVAQLARDGIQSMTEADFKALDAKSPVLGQIAREKHEIAGLQYDLTQGKLSGLPTSEVMTYLNDKVRPVQGDPNFARKDRLYQAAVGSLVQRDAKVASGDVMDVVYGGDKAGLSLFQSQDPVEVRGAITNGIERATRMGYADMARTNPLPTSNAKALAATFTNAPDDQKGLVLDQIKARYGEFAQPVVQQMMRAGKIDPGIQIAMTVPASNPMQQQDRVDLMAALKMPKDQLYKDAMGDDPALKINLQTQMSNYISGTKGLTATFAAQGADGLAYATRDSVERLSVLYVGRGMSTTDAIAKAYKVVGSGFDVDPDGKFRVPAGTIDNAMLMTQAAISNLRPDNIKVDAPQGGQFSQSEYAEQTLNRIRQTGYWITNPTGTGLRMVYQPLPGLVRPVVTTDGKNASVYELSYEDIRAGKQSKTPPAAFFGVP